MASPDALRNFLHVLDLGSLKAAATRAHVTQPALSRQIKALEAELDCSLFERTGRGMSPTGDGQRLALRARPLLARLDALREEFRNQTVSGRLVLGFTPSIGMRWTAALVQRFRKHYPEVSLHLVAVLSGSLAQAIEAGKVDVGLLYSPVGVPKLRTRQLWQEECHFVCRRDHELAGQGSVTLSQVLRHPLLLPSARQGLRGLLERRAEELGMELVMSLEVDSVQLAIELVRQKAGNLLLTGRAVSDIASRQLVALPVRRPRLSRSALLCSTDAALERRTVAALWNFALQSVS